MIAVKICKISINNHSCKENHAYTKEPYLYIPSEETESHFDIANIYFYPQEGKIKS